MHRSPIARLTAMCLVLVLLSLPAPARAIDPSQQAPSGGLSQADLEEMLGPIALYPDELLANVLAASVYPNEITAANKYISGRGDAEKIADQGWEEPVQAIAKIPDLITFLADNIDWTTALGQAYIVQSTDVMTAVQSLRAKAMENGALKSGEQMTVVKEGPTIIIQPTNPQVIYVPQYNPQVVYVTTRPSTGSVVVAGVIGFGIGVAVGACFHDHYYCNWHGGCVGWGWGHGGHNHYSSQTNVNINTGDININSGNSIQGGDRTNIQGGDRINNNIGREGSKWEPNSKKVNTADIKQPGGASKLNDYKGVASKPAAQTRVPTQTIANTGRQSPAAVTREARPTPKPATPAPRPSNVPATPAARPSNTSAAPNTRQAPVTKAPTPRTPTPKAPSPAAKSAAPQSKPSGFSPDRGTGADRSRGAASRQSAGGAPRGGGGAGAGRK